MRPSASCSSRSRWCRWPSPWATSPTAWPRRSGGPWAARTGARRSAATGRQVPGGGRGERGAPRRGRAHLREPGGVRPVRLPQEPRRRLRAAGVPDHLAQGVLPRRVLLRPVQQLAHGLLPAPRVHQRCPAARRRGPATRDQRQPGALHRGEHRGAGRGAPRARVRPGDGATTAAAVVDERDRGGPYRSLRDFAHRTGLAGEAIENAIRVGAFDGLGLRRRGAVVAALAARPGQRGAPATKRTAGRPRYRQLRLDLPTEQDHVPLSEVSGFRAMADDYEVLGLSPDAHPMQFLRSGLRGRSGPAASCSTSRRSGRSTPRAWSSAGSGLAAARGAVFLLLEDEHGLVNVMLAPQLYDRCRTEVRGSPFLRIRGRGRGPCRRQRRHAQGPHGHPGQAPRRPPRPPTARAGADGHTRTCR